jgi:hypothetical protein
MLRFFVDRYKMVSLSGPEPTLRLHKSDSSRILYFLTVITATTTHYFLPYSNPNPLPILSLSLSLSHTHSLTRPRPRAL